MTGSRAQHEREIDEDHSIRIHENRSDLLVWQIQKNYPAVQEIEIDERDHDGLLQRGQIGQVDG